MDNASVAGGSAASIKMLLLSASPRAHGNTAYLASCAAEYAGELPFPVDVATLSLAGRTLRPCTGCLACYKNGGHCVLHDDFEAFRQAWLAADCVVYALPVYVVGIPGQLKCFFDRLHNSVIHYYEKPSARHMKPIGAIAQGGDFGGGQELAMLDIMRHAALINCIYTAPDGSYIGSAGWADGPGGSELIEKREREAPDFAVTLATVQSIVRRTAELAMIIRAGALMCGDYLKNDVRYRPYLDRRQY